MLRTRRSPHRTRAARGVPLDRGNFGRRSGRAVSILGRCPMNVASQNRSPPTTCREFSDRQMNYYHPLSSRNLRHAGWPIHAAVAPKGFPCSWHASHCGFPGVSLIVQAHAQGGLLRAVAGIAMVVTPSFVSPPWSGPQPSSVKRRALAASSPGIATLSGRVPLSSLERTMTYTVRSCLRVKTQSPLS